MGDIELEQDKNYGDIDFDEFDSFSNSEEISSMFGGMSSENELFNEQISSDTINDNINNASNEFFIDDANVNANLSSFDGRQEPYFDESKVEFVDNENNNIGTEEVASFDEYQEPVVEEVTSFEEYQEPVVEEVTSFDEYQEPVVEEVASFDEYQEPVVEEVASFEEYQEPVVEEVTSFEEYQEPVVEEVTSFEEYQEPVVEEVTSFEEYQEPALSADLSEVNAGDVIEQNSNMNNFDFENNIGPLNIVTSENLNYLKWYSGTLSNEVFEFNKSSGKLDFKGTDECNTIHVNVGYDTYGWNVEFSNGVNMSLRDVREYQIRNGSLPCDSGRIIYGSNVLSFEKVNRVVIYEAVKYFSYG